MKIGLHFLSLFYVLITSFSLAQADQHDPFAQSRYGSFVHFDAVPNALFFFEAIEAEDSFEFRKALRNHEIDTVVLASPGGSVLEGLQMAGIIHDRKLTTYIPASTYCVSACSFMFFAGDLRVASGDLGVHQFSVDKQARKKEAPMGVVDFRSQYTVSEIIGFLNEFQTPPFVFERMFETGPDDMYYFSPSELRDFARLGASDDIAPNLERDSETGKLAPLFAENESFINIETFLSRLSSAIGEETCSLSNLEACSEKALCDLATTEFSNSRAWQNDSSLEGYVKEAKKRKLTCGVKQAKPIDLKQAFKSAPKIYRQQLQYALKHLGFYGYETDGLWGSGTKLALENFVLANALENFSEDKVFNNILSKVKVPSSFKTVKVPSSSETVKVPSYRKVTSPSSSKCAVNQTICGFADVYLCQRATLSGLWIKHSYAKDYVKEAKRRGLSCGVR